MSDNIIKVWGEWTDIESLCAQYGVSKRTIYRWLSSGKVEKKHAFGHVTYRVTDTQETSQEPAISPQDPVTHEVSLTLIDAINELKAEVALVRKELAELRIASGRPHSTSLSEPTSDLEEQAKRRAASKLATKKEVASLVERLRLSQS